MKFIPLFIIFVDGKLGKMKKFTSILFLAAMVGSGFAQTTFLKTYNYWNWGNQSKLHCIVSHDDGYSLCGAAKIYGEYVCFLIRTDLNGDTIWTKRFSFPLVKTENTNLAIDNEGNHYIANYIYLFKVSPAGNLLWIKSLDDQKIYDIRTLTYCPTSKRLLLTGLASGGAKLIECNHDGDVLSEKTLSGQPTSLVQLSNGNFVIISLFTSTPFIGYAYARIYTYDPEWNLLIDVRLSLQANDNFYINIGIVEENNDFIGISKGGADEPILVRFNSYGEIIWSTHVNWYTSHYTFRSLMKYTQDQYIVTGAYYPYVYNPNLFVRSYNNRGELVSDTIYTESDYMVGNSIALCPDGGYAICGYMKDNNNLVVPFLFITNKNDNLGKIQNPDTKVKISPNPAQNQVKIEIPELTNGSYFIYIYSITGEKLDKIRIVNKITTVPIQSYKAGMYIYKISSNSINSISGKFIKY